MKAAISVLACAALLTGCAPVASITARNTEGQPEEYKSGYSDGCASGYVAAGHPYSQWSKNVSRYGTDQIYKQGWDDGMMTCKGGYDSIQRSMRR